MGVDMDLRQSKVVGTINPAQQETRGKGAPELVVTESMQKTCVDSMNADGRAVTMRSRAVESLVAGVVAMEVPQRIAAKWLYEKVTGKTPGATDKMPAKVRQRYNSLSYTVRKANAVLEEQGVIAPKTPPKKDETPETETVSFVATKQGKSLLKKLAELTPEQVGELVAEYADGNADTIETVNGAAQDAALKLLIAEAC